VGKTGSSVPTSIYLLLKREVLFDVGLKALTPFLRTPYNHDRSLYHKQLEIKGGTFFTYSISFPLPAELMFCIWHTFNTNKETRTWETHRWPHTINYVVGICGWYVKHWFFTPSYQA